MKEKPDLFIHAGDLFDGVRPGNRALAVAMEGFLRLSRAGIPTVLIAGNHEHPRMRETGSPLRLFEHLDGLHVAYKGRRETFTVPTKAGEVHVHAVPQCADNEALAKEIAAIKKQGTDILVVHGAVRSLPAFGHAEFNELDLDPSWFDRRFEYVALGHYHDTKQVNERTWYCGAPDRVSIAEAGVEKGFLDVTLGEPPRFRALPVRPYVRAPPIDAQGQSDQEILKAVQGALKAAPQGAVMRLAIEEVAADLRGVLDLRRIHEAGSHLLHLEVRVSWHEAGVGVQGGVELGGLWDEFEAFLARQPLKQDREEILKIAKQLLVDAVEGE